MRDGRRLSTCYHEGGHALARWYFGYDTNFAVVLTVADVRAGRWAEANGRPIVGSEAFVDGYGIHDPPFGMKETDPELRMIAVVSRDQELIHMHAGPIAEYVYRRKSSVSCWLTGGIGDLQTINRILDAWFGDDEAARHDALLTAERRAAALIRSKPGAAAIKAMAEALMERGEIDGYEIDAICRAAYAGREPDFSDWVAYWPPSLADIRSGIIHEAETRAAA